MMRKLAYAEKPQLSCIFRTPGDVADADIATSASAATRASNRQCVEGIVSKSPVTYGVTQAAVSDYYGPARRRSMLHYDGTIEAISFTRAKHQRALSES